jgi:hypothetical protein
MQKINQFRRISPHFAAFRRISPHFAAFRRISLILIFFLFSLKAMAQPVTTEDYSATCNLDYSALTAKYRQYKERLYKHFMVMDRDPSGCIHDGIGQNPDDPCKFSVSAFSLPASSINITTNGAFGLGVRNVEGAFNDPNCGRTEADVLYAANPGNEEAYEASGTHWKDNAVHNFLDVGSETPTELGWYWVMLSTEYELLGRNGQYEEQQKTLEDIYLSLQAYRRLDMKAQCIVADMYNRCSDGQIICSELYRKGKVKAKNFDTFYTSDAECAFVPDLSGYSGFAIREDATQVLEPILNDLSEDQYNIDLVSSSYAFSLAPPCTNMIEGAPIDQFCWLGRESDFLSQDQMIGLLYGLRFIKKYIPENATVTLCGNEGTFNVLDIAKKISNGLVSHVLDDPGLTITIPGTEDCTKKSMHIPDAAGGQCLFTAYGMAQINTQINGSTILPPKSLGIAFNAYNALGASSLFNGVTIGTVQAPPGIALFPTPPLPPAYQNPFFSNIKVPDPSGEGFWLQLKSANGDLSDYRWKDKFVNATKYYDKEIYLLGNDILFPEGTPISNGINGKDYFKSLLCDAPCGGPCSKQEDYDPTLLGAPEFNCPNTPNWQGHRWDGLGAQFDNSEDVQNKISNGLDYMVLYNMYSLMYEKDAPYYNPDNVDREGDFPSPNLYIGDEHIVGLNFICIGGLTSSNYTLTPNYSTDNASLTNIGWYGSPNFTVLNTQTRTTTATLNQKKDPSYIGVKFDEKRLINQYSGGSIVVPIPYALGTIIPIYEDVCAFDFRKSVVNKPDYMISTNFKLCSGDYYAKALGLDDPSASYTWLIHDVSGYYPDIYGYGKEINVQIGSLNVQTYQVEVSLTVNDDCGTKKYTTNLFGSCGWGLGNTPTLLVSPNPGKDLISVGISGESYVVPNTGVQIKFNNLSTGVTDKTDQIYSNPTSINTSNLKQGTYQVRARLSNGVYIETPLVITRE